MAKLRCEIATPIKELYSGEATYVEIPGCEGGFGVLPGHEMLVTAMQNGIVTVHLDGGEKLQFASYMGFAQVYEDKVIVLSRMGKPLEEIDVEAVKKEAADLKAKLDAMSEEELAEQKNAVLHARRGTLMADYEWCEAQLNFAGAKAK